MYLRFAHLVTETVARLTTGSGGLTPGPAGFAPAGRQAKFQGDIAFPPIPIDQQSLVALNVLSPKTLALGEALVDVVMSCPHCVMTTHEFDDLAKDPSIMRALVREAGGNLGVYAKPRKLGRVRTGDEVRIERR